MANNKTSAFFAILKTYAPNYEPRENHKENEAKKANKKPQQQAKKEAAPPSPPPVEPTPPAAKKKPTKMRREPSALNREGTSDFSKPEKERSTKSYENWQMVKQEMKEEDTERLKQKIYLQLQLIRAQEVAYQQKIEQQEEEKIKKREEEKAFKRAQTEALLEQCKQSLADDRRKAAQKRRKERTKSTATSITLGGATATNDGHHSEGKLSKTPHEDIAKQYPPQRMPTQALLEDSEDEKEMSAVAPSAYDKQKREGTDISSVASLTPQPTPGKMSPITREITTNITREMTRASTLPEEDEDDDEEREEEFDEFAEYPPYQQQLYRLYGRKNADYFLHPKVEAEAKKQAKKLDPKFKNPDGRTGANELWTNLRKESHGKLLKVDSTIPEELKAAFSCFARESVSKLRKPIRRSYFVKDDVPELDRLLDQSIVQDAQNYRHKMELMFRSSQKNEDRFKVLTYNNPVPNLNNMTGEESVGRYMPSWIDDQDDAESERSYMKWVKPRLTSRTGSTEESVERDEHEDLTLPKVDASKLPTTAAGRPELVDDTGYDVLPSEWDFTLTQKSTKDANKGPKYLFLTERDARTPGQFRKRRQEALEAKKYPAAYTGSQSAMASYGDHNYQAPGPSTYRSGRSAFAVSTEFTLSGGGEPRSRSADYRDIPTWEPLSMNALVEYKQKRETLGSGDFAQGKAPTWNVKPMAVN